MRSALRALPSTFSFRRPTAFDQKFPSRARGAQAAPVQAWFNLPMPKKTSPEPAIPASYGDAMAELEQLVDRLESGQLPLEELLAHYKRGTDLLAYCKQKLQAVEDQVQLLDDRGETQPWTPE